MTSSADQRTAELQEYLRVLRARKLEIAGVAVAVVALTLVLTFRQTPLFEGRAQVWVKPQVNPSSTVSVPQRPNLDTERVLLQSQVVAQRVQRTLHLTAGLEAIRRRLHVDVVSDTEVLVVRYTDPDAATAARLANGFADAYVGFRADQAGAEFQAAATAVTRQIAGVRARLRDVDGRIASTTDPSTLDDLRSDRDTLVAQLGVLQQRLLDITANQSVAESAAEVIEQAAVPSSPVSPEKVRNGVLAVLVGLVMGVGFAFLRERLDDRVRTRHELEHRVGAPVLAAVPRVAGWRSSDSPVLVMRSSPHSPVSEAYRTLATNLVYLASRSRLQVVLVTGATGGDGKTTTSSNLAVALAQTGKRVILVSADLRRPRLHLFFGLPNAAGLSELLSDPSRVPDVADPGIPNLRVLTAGHTSPDPAALLGGLRTGQVLDDLRGAADFVVVDAPPVLAVADTSILAPSVDGVIFVVNAASSSRSALVQARAQLENVGARIVGVVYNNFDPASSTVYPYYDTYYRRYREAPGQAGTAPSSNGEGDAAGRKRQRSVTR